MAHFAQINSDNIVTQVVVVSNDNAPNEAAGITWLHNFYNDNTLVWKQTSYNTYHNEHLLGGTAFRKNYAGIGTTYDGTRDAFIPVKPFNSWVLNETTCDWEAPVESPATREDPYYIWNEDELRWDADNR